MNYIPPSRKKTYYSISEVAETTGLEQHVLRYWEAEFPKLRPKKNRAGNRQYREKDIKTIRYIKHLLYSEMFTVQGAKKKLSESGYKEMEGQLNLLAAIPEPVIIQAKEGGQKSEEKIVQLEVMVKKQEKVITHLKTQLVEIKILIGM